MNNPETGKITWFFKQGNNSVETLGFLRDGFGAFVIGGPTGSHCTGHEEGWKDKLDEYIELGYIDEKEAKETGLISQDWVPPKISRRDKAVVNGIIRGIENNLFS